jgi:hypothetical protein
MFPPSTVVTSPVFHSGLMQERLAPIVGGHLALEQVTAHVIFLLTPRALNAPC